MKRRSEEARALANNKFRQRVEKAKTKYNRKVDRAVDSLLRDYGLADATGFLTPKSDDEEPDFEEPWPGIWCLGKGKTETEDGIKLVDEYGPCHCPPPTDVQKKAAMFALFTDQARSPTLDEYVPSDPVRALALGFRPIITDTDYDLYWYLERISWQRDNT